MIERSIVVAVDPQRAFRAWTEAVHLWWPPSHHPSGDPAGRVVIEAGVGGRFVEHAPDGRQLALGEVLRWEPPSHLRLAFFLGGGSDRPTEVDVTFTAVGSGTEVRVVHRAGALGAGFDAIVERFVHNWEVVTGAFAAHLQAEPPAPIPR